MLKIGDFVSVLKDTIKGRVVDFNGIRVLIEDTDGFERSYLANELVALNDEKSYRITKNIPQKDEQANQRSRNDLQSAIQIPEIDLHIEELIDTTVNLTNYEIVQIQLNACKKFVLKHLNSKSQKIIIIHGKGTGVLKGEIRAFLHDISIDLEKTIRYHDASYNSYGIGGATEVLFL
ncbi:Smr/MutS family protein [Crocinitomix algicola]|uniref:Smr/MutS family protein n=1 Tax=Crocinitomix algicola TaxID=1740263 RepID=UPI000871B48A|nr:Smr/MutS family protein [Crocinitomix algicola]